MEKKENLKQKAVLYAAKAPSESQKIRFEQYLEQHYGKPFTLVFEQDQSLGTGFRLLAETEVIDWTTENRYNQFKIMLEGIDTLQAKTPAELIGLMRSSIDQWE